VIRLLIEKLDRRIRELQPGIYAPCQALSEWRYQPGQLDPTAAASDHDDSAWPVLHVGERWGEPWARGWFRRRVTIPREWAGRPVCLLLSLHSYLPHTMEDALSTPEGLVYIDGVARQAIDRWHREVLLTDRASGGEEYSIAIEGYAGGNLGARTLGLADLASIDRELEGLYFDARTALESARILDDKDPGKFAILNALNEALLQLETHLPHGEAFAASLPRARQYLREHLAAYDDGQQPRIVGVGHAHIDVAWLWPLSVTRGKAARTCATALRLMEQYPDYHYIQSQPQLYQYLKEDHPELLARIRERVAEGRWEANGGMWVEADTNIPSGESLVRQFLYGKRFFRREFGLENDLLWLPDVFGYSAALPQIMAGCGIRNFMTTKISWNEIDRFPYDTFYWQGLDGTRILTHYITAPSGTWFYTYNGDTEPKSLLGSWTNYAQKGLNDELLLSFGHGDGGGGPTKEMLETAARLTDMPAMPHLELNTAGEFFRRLNARKVDWPRWVGELYFEYHRGTYTTQARNKRANRKSEFLYHEAEFLATVANWLGDPYPRAALDTGWQLILVNQFHDILPGSSIGEVYADCARDYARIRELGAGVRARALGTLCGAIDVPGPGPAVVVTNPLSWRRQGVAEVAPWGKLEGMRVLDSAGREVPSQRLDDSRLLFQADAPSYGYAVYTLAQGEPQPAPCNLSVSERALENRFFRLALDERGGIISLYDKQRGREVLPAGAIANEWQAFDDRTRTGGDAWDINYDYEEKRFPLPEAAQVRVIEAGPVRAGIEIRRPILNSSLVQRVYFYERTPRIDFDTEIDWHEKHVLLKVAFPLQVHADQATYEVQFGNLQRPTHHNTSWDAARFEVPAHKWADLSEGDYGVSLLNDCKYGYDAHDNVLRLTVLRATTHPDAHADEGTHHLTYALYPHAGDWRQGTVQQAYQLNAPLTASMVQPHAGPLPGDEWSLVEADRAGVIVETVKIAEDTGELVLRLYECYNQRGRVTLRFGRALSSVGACNLIEDGNEPLPFAGSRVTLDIGPYQIRTIKVTLASLFG
jgi:alpha-mannosidase